MGTIVEINLKTSKLDAEIMLNVTQKSWNGTIEVVKISEIGCFL